MLYLQVSVNVLIILSNLYCVVASILVSELHKLDYFLPILQCGLDLLLSGVLSLVVNIILLNIYRRQSCAQYNFAEVYLQDRYSDSFNFWQTPEWQRYVETQ